MRRVEQRVTGQFLKVEGPSGVVVSLPGWMVDPLVCADMSIGQPQVDLAALSELKRLVTQAAVLTNSPGKVGIAREEVDETARHAGTDLGQAQMSLMFEPRKVDGMNDVERAGAITTLAQLLMQAAGLIVEELDDDQR